MDPQDRLRLRLTGSTCASCGRALRFDGIRILARREELAFVELRCDGCATNTLGFVTGVSADDASADDASADDASADDASSVTLDASGYGEFTADDALRLDSSDPIGPDDVLDMHSLLAAHRGDLDDLIRPTEGGSGPRRSGVRWARSTSR